MSSIEYIEFRRQFAQRMREVIEEAMYGTVMKIAEFTPEVVKSPYNFLLDSEMSRKAKMDLLHAAYKTSQNSYCDLMEYVFDRDVISRLPESYRRQAFGRCKEMLLDDHDRIRDIFDQTHSLIEKARRSGLNTVSEEYELADYERGFQTAQKFGEYLIEVLTSFQFQGIDEQASKEDGKQFLM